MLTGHAPDEAFSDTLKNSFVATTGAPREAATVILADGMPYPNWANDLSALLDSLGGLQRWELTVSDQEASLSGLAADQTALATAQTNLQGWQASAGMSVRQALLAGPEDLTASALEQPLERIRNCGPLSVTGDSFELNATVPVRGNVADAGDAARIATALASVIGSRILDVDVTVLNPELCAIRDVLPVVDTSAMSMRITDGRDGSSNLTGVFQTGENPVVDILLPSTLESGFLWVMVVDNMGKVYHVLPNRDAPESRIENLGVVEGGVRRITALHPLSVAKSDPGKWGVDVNSESYGKSEVIAILLSQGPLFDGQRPRKESIASLKEALTEALTGRESEDISVVSRIIDARK